MPKKPQQLAKLSRPRLYDALPRERLFALLDEKRRHPAIWIAGPPGAGKTALVGSYIEDRKLDALWYQVDTGDNDPSTFFYYLAKAARRMRPARSSLPLLTAEFLPDLAGFTRRYFRELFAWMPQSSVLVLDNFQESAQGPLALVLATAASEVPEHVNVIAISREEPPPAFFSMHLANKTLALIGWEDLKLRFDEARSIAAARNPLDDRTLKMLFERSDGWAAGLILMLERMRRQGWSEDGFEAESQQAVFNYFAAQIFDTASEDTRDTLIRTSVFPAFSLQFAQRISARPGIERLLDELCRRQLFTYRRGSGEPNFYYHDLFREFLQERMNETLSAGERRALYRAAAALLAESGSVEEAHPLFVLSEDWEEAAELVRRFAPSLLAQGRFRTLQQWILAQGDARIGSDPWLLYWLGNALMQDDLKRAVEFLRRAFEAFGAISDRLGQSLSAAELIRALYYQYDDFASMDPWIEAFDRLLATPIAYPDAVSEMKICSALVLALSGRKPGHARLPSIIARTDLLLDADIDANQKIGAGMALLVHYTIVNQLPLAQQIFDRLSPVARSAQVTALNQAYWWLQFGYHQFRRAEIRGAEQAWEEADRFTAERGLKQTFFLGRCFRAFHFAAIFDYRKGKEALDGLEPMLTEARPMTGALYHLGRCALELSQENGTEAARHARLALACTQRLGRPFYDVAWRAHGAAALAMAGDYDTAGQWIEEGWRASSGSRLESYRTNLMMAQAYSAIRQADKSRAHECIREMLRIGREFDSWAYLRTAPTIKDVVLEEALVAGIEVSFVQSVIRKFQMTPRHPEVPNWPWPVRVFTLGEFRIEVDDQPLVFSRKAPKKTLALLKAIIAFGGRNVPEQKLVDALWSDEDVNCARESLAVGLHRLRKLLVHPEAVQLVEGQITLDPRICRVDVWSFERAASESERQPEKTAVADPVWEIYRGHFLVEEIDAPWALSTRERLRAQFLRYVSSAGRRHEGDGSLDVAVRLYQKGIEADDLAEEMYQGLMRCHLKLDRRAEGMAAYRRLRQTLWVTLGIAPSAESERLFKSIQGA